MLCEYMNLPLIFISGPSPGETFPPGCCPDFGSKSTITSQSPSPSEDCPNFNYMYASIIGLSIAVALLFFSLVGVLAYYRYKSKRADQAPNGFSLIHPVKAPLLSIESNLNLPQTCL